VSRPCLHEYGEFPISRSAMLMTLPGVMLDDNVRNSRLEILAASLTSLCSCAAVHERDRGAHRQARPDQHRVLPHSFFSYMRSNGTASIDSWATALTWTCCARSSTSFSSCTWVTLQTCCTGLTCTLLCNAVVSSLTTRSRTTTPLCAMFVPRQTCAARRCPLQIHTNAPQHVRDFFVRRIAVACEARRQRIASHSEPVGQLPPWLRGGDDWVVDGSGECGKQADATECGVYALGAADDIAHGRASIVTPATVVGRRARFGRMLLQ
jgi:hypothetical protein